VINVGAVVVVGGLLVGVAGAWRAAVATWQRRVVLVRVPCSAESRRVARLGAIAHTLASRAGRGRARDRYEQRLPYALDAVARSLRSGAALRSALAEAAAATPGPVGDDLLRVVRSSEHGRTLAGALDEWAQHRPFPVVALAAAALAMGAEHGGAQARAVDGVAATLRDRLAVVAEIRALSSSARASAAVIGIAPLAFCAFTASTDPRAARFLFRTGPGLMVLATGLALDGLAAVWMRRITRAAP
jgi:tight adherence protein B